MGVAVPASAQGATLDVRETFGQEAVTYIAADGEENDVTMRPIATRASGA